MYLKIRMHDCSSKFLDDTKTCVQLFLKPFIQDEVCVAYVFTSETQDEVLKDKEKYLEAMLQAIRDNATWDV